VRVAAATERGLAALAAGDVPGAVAAGDEAAGLCGEAQLGPQPAGLARLIREAGEAARRARAAERRAAGDAALGEAAEAADRGALALASAKLLAAR
jgi:hypothetical protein